MRFGGLSSPASEVGEVSLRNAETVARMFDQALSWVSTTPLGAPVVAEVSRISAGSVPTIPLTAAKAVAIALALADVTGVVRGMRGKGVTGTGTSAAHGSSGSAMTAVMPRASTTRLTSAAGA